MPAPSLGAYLTEAMRRPFAWGSADCFLFPADWVRLRRGLDPAAAWRGAYASEAEAAEILAAHGGPEALFMRAALACGLEPTAQPRAGDVGLVNIRGQLTGSVRTGRRWAVRTASGLWVRDFDFVQAWSV